MYQFILNGKEVVVKEDKKLLDYLRDDMGFTSVKDGCSEGACGTCMVIVDGKAMRACLITTAKAVGKEITTVEGLSDEEKEVYVWAFGEAGAVQCGFCIPGMIISAKVLLDKNLNPSREEVKSAIRGNICRCTGYVKIEKAIMMVAEAFRSGRRPESIEVSAKPGQRFIRIDARDKVLGIGEYVNDMKFEGMIYGSALRTKYPRALVKKINIEDALRHPEVETILVAKDIPGKRYIGHLAKDWPALIEEGEITRYLGDAVALVAAKTKKGLKEILDLIKVEYEELAPLSTPEMAMEENAPRIHENGNILRKEVLKRGNADEAIAKAKYVVTKTYKTPSTEHAFLEPESSIAHMDGDSVVIYTSAQGIYDVQKECAEVLGLPKEQVRAVGKYVGGGFGGKEDMVVQHHAALLTWYTKKPVVVTLSRKESLIIHPKRHAMDMEFTTACDENGILTGMKAKLISDTGAYASLGGPVLQRACTHAAGPYNYHNIDIEGVAVYTNNPPAGAFRGFGVTQSAFATECNLNLLAEMVGISAWEIRYRNALVPGQVLPNGQIADESTAIKETLLAVKDEFEKNKFVGVACALKNSGVGVGIPDTGRCRIDIIDGKARVRAGAVCLGQGLATVAMQIVCHATGLHHNSVAIDTPDTAITPNSGTSTASRQTVVTGEAIKRAAFELKEALKGKELCDLEGKSFYAEYVTETDPMGSDKSNPVSHVAYGYATQLVVLDDAGKVQKVVAAHDVGRSINPTNIEGQIEGGVVMGLGFALTEVYPLKDSVPLVKFGTLGLLRATDVPEIESIIIEKSPYDLAFGAKGIGEIVVIPTAPAVQGAYLKYDGKFRTTLPLEGTAYRK